MKELYKTLQTGGSFYLLNEIDGRAIKLFAKDNEMRAVAKAPKSQEYSVDASSDLVMVAIHDFKKMSEKAYNDF